MNILKYWTHRFIMFFAAHTAVEQKESRLHMRDEGFHLQCECNFASSSFWLHYRVELKHMQLYVTQIRFFLRAVKTGIYFYKSDFMRSRLNLLPYNSNVICSFRQAFCFFSTVYCYHDRLDSWLFFSFSFLIVSSEQVKKRVNRFDYIEHFSVSFATL